MIGLVEASAGKPVAIEGYAQDFDAPIEAMQFSCDNGETWTSFATPNAEQDKNVNWSFVFTPPEAGIYRLLIRAVGTDGRITPQAACVTVDACEAN